MRFGPLRIAAGTAIFMVLQVLALGLVYFGDDAEALAQPICRCLAVTGGGSCGCRSNRGRGIAQR